MNQLSYVKFCALKDSHERLSLHESQVCWGLRSARISRWGHQTVYGSTKCHPKVRKSASQVSFSTLSCEDSGATAPGKHEPLSRVIPNSRGKLPSSYRKKEHHLGPGFDWPWLGRTRRGLNDRKSKLWFLNHREEPIVFKQPIFEKKMYSSLQYFHLFLEWKGEKMQQFSL